MATEAPPTPPAAASPAAAAAPAPNVIDPLPVPSTPPRPGSGRERMRKETAPKWEGDEGTADKTVAAPAKTPETRPGQPEAKPGEVKSGKESEAGEGTTPPPEITPEQKKKNPWVLMRQEKERADRLERQLAEGKSSPLADKEKTDYLDRIQKAEEKIKKYEDDVRFSSYEKSEEFKAKYDEPYLKAWNKHMREMREVPVNMEDGTTRMTKEEDILELVNLPLGTAKKLAVERFGDFANEAMLARKEIRDTFEAKATALEEARKNGADREKQFQENAAKWRADVQKHIKETWDEANQMALSDSKNGEYFKPVDGDDTRNQLLGKGFALVDEAFSKNPMDAKLTPEERSQVVRKHAAVRNRAAAFGPMKYLISRLRAEIEALKKANDGFKGSQPPAGGGTAAAPGGVAAAGKARDRMHSAGDKYAK